MGLNRRSFTAAALAGGFCGLAGAPAWAAARRVDSTIGGVKIGIITYSYRELPAQPGEDLLAPGIRGCLANGIGEVELWATMVQPPTILQRLVFEGPTLEHRVEIGTVGAFAKDRRSRAKPQFTSLEAAHELEFGAGELAKGVELPQRTPLAGRSNSTDWFRGDFDRARHGAPFCTRGF